LNRRAVFLDRDGVINEERGYVHTPEQFVLLPRVVAAIRSLRLSGFKVIVITNQSGVARGFFNVATVDKLHRHFQEILGAEGEQVDGIYYCPHHPEGTVKGYAVHCDCRKPMPGLLLQAAKELNLDLSASYLVGDKLSDIQAGRQAGLREEFLVRTGHPLPGEAISYANYVVNDLYEAASVINQMENAVRHQGKAPHV
jgi:D-glycero-D-manno-heptose 1,7-bisphosphate phosphatase